MPYCQMCGKPIAEEAATCLYCGSALQDNPDNPGSARFCRCCGKPIDNPGTSEISNTYETYEIPSLEATPLQETQEEKTCPLCGNGVKTDVKSCPYCGVGLQ